MLDDEDDDHRDDRNEDATGDEPARVGQGPSLDKQSTGTSA
jgi:hypothetical protein